MTASTSISRCPPWATNCCWPRQPRPAPAQPTENDVAKGFGEGKTYKEVARDLGLSPNTVRHHIRAIYTKLGVKDKARIAHLVHARPTDPAHFSTVYHGRFSTVTGCCCPFSAFSHETLR